MCSEPLSPPERGGLPSVQWALHPSWERRFAQCAVGPSSLLRAEVYPVCSGPLIPPERGGLPSVQWALPPSWERRLIPSVQWALPPSWERRLIPSVQWALHPSWERRFIPTVQWALHPSWKRRFTQCAMGPSSLLRAEVYPVCSGPLIPPESGGLPSVQWALPPSWERRLIPSVQWALHRSWERRFTQCAVSPSSLLREEVYLVCSGPFIPLERGGLPSV